MSRYVISPQATPAYSPANHTGTSNQRIISHASVGARHVEVLIGTIVKGHGAQAHAHPTLEQASLILEGFGAGERDGVQVEVRTGEWLFNPIGSFHKFTTCSDRPVKVLVIYAPPYAENPEAAILYDEQSKAAGHLIGEGSHTLHTRQDMTFTPDHHDAGTVALPILSDKLGGSQHLTIFEQHTHPGKGAEQHALADTERVVIIRQGCLTGSIDGEAFEASAGDWLFVPEGVHISYQATGDATMQALVIQAHP